MAVSAPPRIRDLLKPPVFADDVLTQQAHNLHRGLVWFVPVTGFYALGMSLALPEAWARYLVLLLAVLTGVFVALRLNHAGRVRQGSWLILGLVWTAIAVFGVASGGFEAVGYLIGTTVIVAAGVLLGPRAALGMAGVTIVYGLLLAVAEERGLLPPPTVLHTRTSTAIVAASAFVLLVLLMQLSARGLLEALTRAQHELVERRQAEAALETSRHQYEELVASVPGAVYEFREAADGQRGFPFVSEGIRDLLGVAPQEVMRDPATVFDRVAPDAREELARSMRASHDALTPWHHDFPITTPDGVARWIRGRSVPTAEPGGGVRSHGVLIDITDQRQAVSLLRATLESTADGILVVDSAGAVTGFNKRFLKLWKIPPDVAASEDDARWLGFVLDQLADPEEFLTRVRALYADPDAISVDELIFRDGRVFERYSRPQRIDGRTVGRVWSFRDVSSARQASEETRRLELQLFEAQKLEALGTLAGGIAHDFNNILTAIVGHTELARWEVGGEARAALDEVIHAADRARDLVQQILLVGRGRQEVYAPLALGAVLEDALRLLRATIPRGIAIETDLADDEIVILGHRSQLHQVVMNLGVNAWHAMGDQGRLAFSLRCLDVAAHQPPVPGMAPGPYALLSVRDNGHGMTPDTLQRVFDPFFTTKERGRGTGLGLSVVRGIVHGHDGAIAVDSTPGAGTEFRLYFPRQAASAPTEPVGTRGIPRGRGQRVLAVDDEPAIAEILRTMLRRLGYQPTVCSDPREALRLVEAAPDQVDLIFTDLSMPGMTGIELGMAALDRCPGLPIVVVTGFDQGWTRERVRGLGFSDLVSKPYSAGQVAEVLAAALGMGFGVAGEGSGVREGGRRQDGGHGGVDSGNSGL